jgi:hypothetical protein
MNTGLLDTMYHWILTIRAPHNPKVVGSNPAPATKENPEAVWLLGFFIF